MDSRQIPLIRVSTSAFRICSNMFTSPTKLHLPITQASTSNGIVWEAPVGSKKKSGEEGAGSSRIDAIMKVIIETQGGPSKIQSLFFLKMRYGHVRLIVGLSNHSSGMFKMPKMCRGKTSCGMMHMRKHPWPKRAGSWCVKSTGNNDERWKTGANTNECISFNFHPTVIMRRTVDGAGDNVFPYIKRSDSSRMQDPLELLELGKNLKALRIRNKGQWEP